MNFRIHSTKDVIYFNFWLAVKSLLGLRKDKPFNSAVYNFSFSSVSDYWLEIGKRDALLEVLANSSKSQVKGIAYSEVAAKASMSEFGLGPGVILLDISIDHARITLQGLDIPKSSILMEDVVFIHCNSREQALKIVRKIPRVMAEACAVERGFIFESNW